MLSHTRSLTRFAAAAGAALALAAGPAAAQKITFTLNWVAGGDHAPYFYAQKMGWYKQAGLDVEFETGRGSAVSAQKVGAGATQMGLSDMAVVLNAIGKGADLVAIMNVYANSPQGLYWLKSSGIKGIKDFVGKKIGNPPGDAARTMWPAIARANGIDPKSVTWVNIDANSKLSALKAKSIDVTTSFYNIHHIFARELKDDMGFIAWRNVGLNPYGNSIVANGKWLKANRDKAAAFVKVTQKAFADCVKAPEPCVKALVEAHGALKLDNEMVNWQLVTVLMSDETSRGVALGWHDDKRMAADYKLVAEYVKIDKPFNVKDAYTNAFLDKSIKMIAVKEPKFY
jgi:NitT/TauT family transport system substrate-binding protein